jgi:hypothetical protein
MPKKVLTQPLPAWDISSIFVKVRDGPDRLEQAYRFLLEPDRQWKPKPSPSRERQAEHKPGGT